MDLGSRRYRRSQHYARRQWALRPKRAVRTLHIFLAIFVIAGCWCLIVLLFGPKLKWGYEFWIIAVAAAWFFDRVLRFMRILKNGVRRSKVTEIGGDIVRIDVQGVRWGATSG